MLEIRSPKLILNRETVSNNIEFMYKKAERLGLEFRPHFKTHQSIEIGNLFKQQGVTGITVSSINMAKYFANLGWGDITIAIPFNILEIEALNKLAQKATISVLVVDRDVIKFLENKLTVNLKAYIEIDTGQKRSGVAHNHFEQIDNLVETIRSCDKIEFAGFYAHSGHTYNCRSKNEILDIGRQAIEKLNALFDRYKAPICYGDTPSCSVMNDFGKVSQISPGNFVFYDWMQVIIGSSEPKNIAVALFCPVLAKYSSRKEILIHGGAVHLSKEFMLRDNSMPYFGVVSKAFDKSGVGNIVENVFVKSLSQEHGIIECTDEYFNSVQIGDVIPVIPIHSCLTADLMSGYVDLNGNAIDHLSAAAK